ncbi:hypothetical protein AMR41_30875 [Hapalosiphon sp. MRB220]|nr:hypothetical protein AMR41_30875 [Hapalosiphon sp. MRB220]
MLQVTGKTNSVNAYNVADLDLSHELSDYETSSIIAGFSIDNQSKTDQRFFTFSDSLDPTEQTLKKGKKGDDYDGDYILFDSLKNGYKPALSGKLKSSGKYKFSRKGNDILFGGIGG